MTQDQVRSRVAGSGTSGSSALGRLGARAQGITGFGRERRLRSGLTLTAATAVILLVGAPSARADLAYNFVTISDPTPDATDTMATGVNNTGQIVGTYQDASGNSTGFSLSGGAYSGVTVSGAAMTTASGVSNSGQITGYYADNTGVHGFNQVGATTTPIDETNAHSGGATYAAGSNTSGTTVGYCFDSALAEHGFRQTGAGFTTVDVAGAQATQVLGVNASNQMVGSYSDGTSTHGFLTDGVTTTTLDVPGAKQTVATGIDAYGDIVGYYMDGGGITHGFIDLNGTLFTIDDPNAATVTEVLGVSDILGVSNGLMVVGYYIDPQGVLSGFSAEIPEPATIGLFGLGVLGIGALRRRRSGGA